MPEEKDFDYVVGKLPRRDKDGNDTTGDRIGKGGRHRDDGTYSAVAYDGLVNLTERGINAGISAVKRKAAAKREKRVQQKKEVTAHIEPSESAQMATTPEKATTVLDEIDAAYDNYSINMTSEEAQKEFVDAFILRVLSEKKLWKIAHANIVDPAGNITDGRAMIDKLSSPLMLENINTILKNNPALLETWQTIALEDILGRELIVDSCYVPIEGQALRKNLMSLSV